MTTFYGAPGGYRLIRGDRFRLPVLCVDEDGDPVNVSAYTGTARIADRSNTIVINAAVDATAAASGQLVLTWVAADTALLVPTSTYRLQLRITNGADIQTPLDATLRADPSVYTI